MRSFTLGLDLEYIYSLNNLLLLDSDKISKIFVSYHSVYGSINDTKPCSCTELSKITIS